VAAFILASGPLESEAKGADAFTPQHQTPHSQRNRDSFSQAAKKPSSNGPGKPNNNGSDGGVDDDNGMPQYPKTESVQETEKRIENIDEYIARMEESSDSEEEQCEATEQKKEIRSRIKEDPGLVRAAKEACKNMDVQKDITHLEEELAKGNENPGIGRKPICKGVTEHRGKNGGRLYVRESDDNEIEILAKSGKKKSNQKFLINRLKEIYG
jgi:TolA-binding protein